MGDDQLEAVMREQRLTEVEGSGKEEDDLQSFAKAYAVEARQRRQQTALCWMEDMKQSQA